MRQEDFRKVLRESLDYQNKFLELEVRNMVNKTMTNVLQPLQIRVLARQNAELGHIDAVAETMLIKEESCQSLPEIRSIFEVDWEGRKKKVKEEWEVIIKK